MKDFIGRLFVYEKCHQQVDLSFLGEDAFFEIYIVQRPDPSFVARGDECSAYLTHITQRYDEL